MEGCLLNTRAIVLEIVVQSIGTAVCTGSPSAGCPYPMEEIGREGLVENDQGAGSLDILCRTLKEARIPRGHDQRVYVSGLIDYVYYM